MKLTALEVIKSLLVLLFAYTAVSKFLDYKSFEGVLHQSTMLSKYAQAIAIALPSIELIVAILLINSKTQHLGLWASLILMILFSGYIGFMMLTSSKLPCSCGGVLKTMSWKDHLLFNFSFLLLSGFAIFLLKAVRKPNNQDQLSDNLFAQTGEAENLK